jgi:tetratricopeptide (TPR) repeat protein
MEPALVPGLADSVETQAGAALGTPAYMSPEQAQGRLDLLGPASDLYSLGATLYTLLTGRPPVEGKDTAEMLQKAQRGDWLRPRQVKADVPPALDAICRKAMALRPEQRYATALDLAADMERWLADEPVAAYPEPWTARSRRWMRRHRTLVTTAVGALLVAVVSLSGFALLLAHAQSATEEARQDAVANEHQARIAQRAADETVSLALGTLRSMLTKVQEDLADVPNTHVLRQEITRMALEGAQKVVESTRDTPDLIRIRAKALSQMGDVLSFQGQYARAREHYQEAHHLAFALVDADPQSDKARNNLAAMLTALGDMDVRQHNMHGAARNYEEALRLRKEIHDHPRSEDLKPAERKLALANAYLRVASVRADLPTALDFHRQALDLRQQAVDLEPEDFQAQQDLAQSFAAMAEICRHRRQRAGARDYECKARIVWDNQARVYPRKLAVQNDRALVYLRLGEDCLRLQQSAEAREAFAGAQRICQRLLDGDPGNERHRSSLYLAHYGVATAALALGDRAAAERDFRKALGLYEDRLRAQPDNPELLTPIMLCRARLGEHAQAVELAEKVRKLAKGSLSSLQEVASAYALSVPAVANGRLPSQLTAAGRDLQQRYTTRALEALRQLKSNGWGDWVSLETEPDLVPLRGNPDFEKLLEEWRRDYPLPR